MSSTSSTEAALGSHRLSVRNRPNRQQERPSVTQSAFRQSLDYETLALTGETEWRAVAEGSTRRIETVTDGIDALDEYIENKKHASLVLREVTEDEVRVLPYNHRWTSAYRNRLYARLKEAERALERWYGEGPVPTTMLSLTAHQTDENGDPIPPGQVLENLADGWDKFRRAMGRATEGHKTEYVRVIEPHESGYPHVHVLIFGVAMPSMADKIQELWVEKYGVGGAEAHQDAVTVARGRTAQLQSAAAYLMKYLTKTVVRADGDQQKVDGYRAFSALLWTTGARQFSTSEGLSAAMKMGESTPDPTEVWEFVGVGYGLEPGWYEGGEARELLEHLDRGPWKPPPGGAVAGHVRHRPLGDGGPHA